MASGSGTARKEKGPPKGQKYEVRDIANELGMIRCRDILRKRIEAWGINDNGLDCWESKGALNPQGYGSVRAYTNGQVEDKIRTGRPHDRNSGKNYTLHRLSFYVYRPDEELSLQRDIVISHLCNNKKCFNPAHLTQEPQSVNLSRDKCQAFSIVCPKHDVTVYSIECTHLPPCWHTETKYAHGCCLTGHSAPPASSPVRSSPIPLPPYSPTDEESAILAATQSIHDVDVDFVTDEDDERGSAADPEVELPNLPLQQLSAYPSSESQPSSPEARPPPRKRSRTVRLPLVVISSSTPEAEAAAPPAQDPNEVSTQDTSGASSTTSAIPETPNDGSPI